MELFKRIILSIILEIGGKIQVKEKVKRYEFTLRTLAPVHIGSGDIYTAKEYIYENKSFYFPDMGLLYQEIESHGPQMRANFETFLMRSGNYHNKRNPRLIDFLNEQKIKSRNYAGYRINETGFEVDGEDRKRGGILNEISSFIKDSYGNPYIPGSSLKGAIRTIIVNQILFTDQIKWGSSRNGKFEDLFHHIRVSDSDPISPDQLILAQKWDLPIKDGSIAKTRPIHRECLKPFTIARFTITAIGDEAIKIMDQLNVKSEVHYKEYQQKLLKKFPDRYTQNNLFRPIYLGAGSGFWTKTQISKADPSRHRGGKMKMVREGALKLTKAPSLKYKKNGEIYSLLQNSDNLYEMGKCGFLMKEVIN